MRLKSLLISIVAAPLLSAQTVPTVVVNSSVSGLPGSFVYAYQIQNQTNSGVLLFALLVTGQVRGIQAPAGWVTSTTIPSPDETLVEWISTDVPFDAGPFGALGGFAFTSPDGPGTATFAAFDENFSEFDGQTTGPVVSTTPEPGTALLIVTAFVALLVCKKAFALSVVR